MLVTAAPPVTVVDGLVGIAVAAVAIAAETEPPGDEDIVDTRLIELSTFVAFTSLAIVPLRRRLPTSSLAPLRSSHINAKIQRDPSQVRGGELVGGSGHRFAPILLFNLDSDRFVALRIMSRDGRDSLGPCRRILDTRFASLPTRRETENSRSNRSRRLSGN